MWIFTDVGFFSIVHKKPDDEFLTVRARLASDLDNLREKYCPTLGETISTPNGDYEYRALVSYHDWAEAMSSIAMNIRYSNFKDEVKLTQGCNRSLIYSRVWFVVNELSSLN